MDPSYSTPLASYSIDCLMQCRVSRSGICSSDVTRQQAGLAAQMFDAFVGRPRPAASAAERAITVGGACGKDRRFRYEDPPTHARQSSESEEDIPKPPADMPGVRR